jgi:hypothetical protein
MDPQCQQGTSGDSGQVEKQVTLTHDNHIDGSMSAPTTRTVRNDLSQSTSESSTVQIASRSVLRYIQSNFHSSNSLAATQFSDDSDRFARPLGSCGLNQGAAIHSAELSEADTSIHFVRHSSPSASNINSPASVENYTGVDPHLRDRLFYQSQRLPIEESLQGATHRIIQDFVAIGFEHQAIVHESIIPKEAQLRRIESEIERSCAAIEEMDRKIARYKALLEKHKSAQSTSKDAAN